MEPNVFDKVHEVDLKKTMEQSYIDYAMSVISARALPDVRDGLKPVQRRVLYSMIELNNGPDKPHRKCARIVGDTMGKYHPHGDSSIYGALVNMAQEWSTRYPLVDGHGNFGSVDGDGAAAMRYTEARLSKISVEMLEDIRSTPDFDVLGHIDYVVRYGNGKAEGYSYQKYADEIDEILKAVIERGKGIELNMAGLKYGLPFAHPHPDILKRYRELGGEIVTVGADGHRPEHIAWEFDKACDILKGCNFKYYTEFKERKPIFLTLP